MSSEASRLISDIVVESTVALFAAFGLELRGSGAFSIPLRTECTKLAVVGFAGKQMCGSLLINAGDDLLSQAYPVLSVRADERDLRDWIGELANQLVGRIKKQLLGYDVTIQLSTPIALSGSDIRIGAPMDGALCIEHRFAVGDGWVQVRFETVVETDFVLLAPSPPRDLATEGDVLMF